MVTAVVQASARFASTASTPRAAKCNTRYQQRTVAARVVSSGRSQQRRLRRDSLRICAADASAETEVQEMSVATSRYKVKLGKPLGMFLEQNAAGTIYVGELVPEGAAEKSGVIAVGDRLISTTGYVYTTSQEYNEITVKGGEQIVTMNVKGESFDTVMAAIASHPGNFKVTLELERGPSASMSEM